MEADDKKRVRLIVRQVHPDLFANSPYERQCNSESLKNLNAYVDELSKGRAPRPVALEFYVREGSSLRKVETQLGASGSVAPLFFAFGLITAEELRATDSVSSASDTNFLGWLRDQVQDAVRTADKHDVLKWHIRRLKSSLEDLYQLAAVQAGAEYAVSLAEQERQVESLKILEQGLLAAAQRLRAEDCFEGLTVQLYHPEACPQEAYSYVDHDGTFNMRTSYMKSFVGDDGALHLVADRATIRDQILSLDLERARMLAEVSFFWLKRVRDLTPVVTTLLGVRSVWCDTKTEQVSQKFVLWAGYLLEKREEVAAQLFGRKYSFSIIVHAEPYGPLINFHQSSPIVNVRADCPPAHLVDFLISEGGQAASAAANEVAASRAKEEALLDRVRQVFDAKCVIKICMNDKVVEGARRLLDNADTIKQAVDLRGACIALDDCYEVWDSGFISIPYNFKIQELSSMVKMLQSGQRPGDVSAAGSGAAAGSNNGAATAEASPVSSNGAAGSNGARAPRDGAAPTPADVNGAAVASSRPSDSSPGTNGVSNGSAGVTHSHDADSIPGVTVAPGHAPSPVGSNGHSNGASAVPVGAPSSGTTASTRSGSPPPPPPPAAPAAGTGASKHANGTRVHANGRSNGRLGGGSNGGGSGSAPPVGAASGSRQAVVASAHGAARCAPPHMQWAPGLIRRSLVGGAASHAGPSVGPTRRGMTPPFASRLGVPPTAARTTQRRAGSSSGSARAVRM